MSLYDHSRRIEWAKSKSVQQRGPIRLWRAPVLMQNFRSFADSGRLVLGHSWLQTDINGHCQLWFAPAMTCNSLQTGWVTKHVAGKMEGTNLKPPGFEELCEAAVSTLESTDPWNPVCAQKGVKLYWLESNEGCRKTMPKKTPHRATRKWSWTLLVFLHVLALSFPCLHVV